MTTFSKIKSPLSPAITRKRGFTMVELMFSIGILSIVMAAILPPFITLTKSLVSIGNYSEMSYNSRMAVEKIGRDIRGAVSLTTADSSRLIMEMPTDAGSITVTYRYNADSGILFRQVADSSGSTQRESLLEDLTEFAFIYYNRLGNTSTTASILTETKSINVDAIMSRDVLKQKNTDHIISAKFMMRNAN